MTLDYSTCLLAVIVEAKRDAMVATQNLEDEKKAHEETEAALEECQRERDAYRAEVETLRAELARKGRRR